MDIETLKPILAAHLLKPVDDKLVELLLALSTDEWEKATIVPGWSVKNIAAHLLDTQIRKLSLVRDRYLRPGEGPGSDEDLPAFINRMNADGVAIYSRFSPGILIDLIERFSAESSSFHLSLAPFAPATFPVSWAGETESQNWFDTARELTERWHHQQQIRLATGRPGIMTPELYRPVLDTFMRALPYHYRRVEAANGSQVGFTIDGECGGKWHLYRDGHDWRLIARPIGKSIAEATIPGEIAWRIFTKGINREEAARVVTFSGDKTLAVPILNMLSIVA